MKAPSDRLLQYYIAHVTTESKKGKINKFSPEVLLSLNKIRLKIACPEVFNGRN